MKIRAIATATLVAFAPTGAIAEPIGKCIPWVLTPRDYDFMTFSPFGTPRMPELATEAIKRLADGRLLIISRDISPETQLALLEAVHHSLALCEAMSKDQK